MAATVLERSRRVAAELAEALRLRRPGRTFCQERARAREALARAAVLRHAQLGRRRARACCAAVRQQARAGLCWCGRGGAATQRA